MKKLVKGGKVYRKGSFCDCTLVYEDGIISEITDVDVTCDGEIYDASGCYVIPGLIDIHTHGGYGVDANDADCEAYGRIGHFFAGQGTTSWMCSILTDTEEQTIKCIKEAVKYSRTGKNGAHLAGIHLEGPFLSAEYKGAMPEHLLRKPDIELLKRYQEAAEGLIRYITVSPEVEGIPEAVSQIRELGMNVAIGHSGADYDTAYACIRNGAVSATHTFNAMKLMHQHFPAIAGAVLESDVYCEAICDGFHLHPGVVRLLLKTKGYDRVVAITDSIMAAGLPDGEYKLGVNDVVVINGDARLKEADVRAGSTLTMGRAMRNLMKFTGEPLEKVLPLLTKNPSEVVGLSEHIGTLDIGKDADIVILDQDYQIKDTIVKGNLIKK